MQFAYKCLLDTLVTFVDDSPKLDDNSTTLTADFTVSRSAKLIECTIRRQGEVLERVNCKCDIINVHVAVVYWAPPLNE